VRELSFDRGEASKSRGGCSSPAHPLTLSTVFTCYIYSRGYTTTSDNRKPIKYSPTNQSLFVIETLWLSFSLCPALNVINTHPYSPSPPLSANQPSHYLVSVSVDSLRLYHSALNRQPGFALYVGETMQAFYPITLCPRRRRQTSLIREGPA